MPADDDYVGFRQFRDSRGEPIFPQRPMLIGPTVAYTGAGAEQSGRFHGKMIVLGSLMDESAFPWQADWYRKKVSEFLGDETNSAFRLWYSDNAMHGGSRDYTPEMSLHIVSYQGALNQALLDVSNWVEKGIVPPRSTEYSMDGAQVKVPENAFLRKGIQPVVTLTANGNVAAHVKAGEAVNFEGVIEVPEHAGKVTYAELDFDGTADYADKADLIFQKDKTKATVRATHSFDQPGTYFVVLRAASNRNGDASNAYTQVKNLARVRIVAE